MSEQSSPTNPNPTLTLCDFHCQSLVINQGYVRAEDMGDEEVTAIAQIHTDARMIACSDAGVVIGEGAHEYAFRQATDEANKQDLLEPLYEKAPYPLESSGDLVVIPSKIGEARGIYFARVLSTLIDKNDGPNEAIKNFADAFAIELLFDNRTDRSRGKLFVRPKLNDDKTIEMELALLKKVVETGELTDLSPQELNLVSILAVNTKNRHTALKQAVHQNNVATVEEVIQERKTDLRGKRFAKKIGAAACIVASLTMFTIAKYASEPVSDQTKAFALEQTQDLEATLRLRLKLLMDPASKGILEQESQDVIDQTTQKLSSNDLSSQDRQALQDVLEEAGQTKSLLSVDPVTNTPERNAMLATLTRKESTFEAPSSPETSTLLLGSVGLIYLGGAAGLLYSASKNGGRRDPTRTKVLPAVTNGELLPYSFVQETNSRTAFMYNIVNG